MVKKMEGFLLLMAAFVLLPGMTVSASKIADSDMDESIMKEIEAHVFGQDPSLKEAEIQSLAKEIYEEKYMESMSLAADETDGNFVDEAYENMLEKETYIVELISSHSGERTSRESWEYNLEYLKQHYEEIMGLESINAWYVDSYIEDYEVEFGKKHLSDPFVLEGINSISARDKILREIFSNLLAHRDYSSAYVAKFVTERQNMYTENASRAHGFGVLELSSFEPFSKNPSVSKVFREISLADELGSGMRNTYKYTKLYSGGTPKFIEGNIFKTVIPLTPVSVGKVGPSGINLDTDQVSDQVSDQVNIQLDESNQDIDIFQRILTFCQVEKSKKEICEYMGYRNRTFFTRKYLSPLIQKGELRMTQSDKPNSRNQKYITVKSKEK